MIYAIMSWETHNRDQTQFVNPRRSKAASLDNAIFSDKQYFQEKLTTKTFAQKYCIISTSCPWVSEDLAEE